jgi:hypothetical protein
MEIYGFTRKIETGSHIRSYDHKPVEGRPEMFIEGIITKIKNNKVYVHVLKDSVFPLGMRLSVVIQAELIIGDYEDRIQVLGQCNF